MLSQATLLPLASYFPLAPVSLGCFTDRHFLATLKLNALVTLPANRLNVTQPFAA
jgi:hypothetical protein